MNFLYGVLVIAIVILALKTITKTVASLWRWFRPLMRTGRRRCTMKDGVTAPPAEERALHSAPDWQALSRELRQSILARGVRASGQSQKLAQLDEAIEIEKREIELARLRAEKSQLKGRQKSVLTTAQSNRKGHGANPSPVPVAQLKAMREATRPGQPKQPTATPLSPLHH